MKHDISKHKTDFEEAQRAFWSTVAQPPNLKNFPINSYGIDAVEFNERNNTVENKHEEVREKKLRIRRKREELELLELEYSLLVKKINQKVKRKRIL